MSARKMTLRTFGEIVTAISVVAGLFLVAFEINANTAASQAQARQELAAQNIEFLLRVSEDDELAELWTAEWTSEYLAGLTRKERGQATMIAIALVIRLENVYLQYEQDLIEEEALPNYGMIQFKFEEEGFWEIMDGLLGGTFDPDFWEYFLSLHGRR